MSRNLIHYDLERLDNLPTRGNIHDRLNSSLETKRVHWKWSSDRSDSKWWRQARHTLHGSVGTHIDVVFPKVRALMAKTHEDPKTGVFGIIDKTILIDNELHYAVGRWSRPSKISGLYIDLDGIIRYKACSRTRYRYGTSKPIVRMPRRYYYEKLSAERKEVRDRTKFLSEGDRFTSDLVKSNAKAKYFRSLLINKEKRESIIKSPKPEYPSSQHSVWYAGGRKLVDKTPAQFQKDIDEHKISLENYWNKKVLAQKELEELNIEIESFRNKDFKNFYQSYEYINSVNKPCHHFEQP